MRVCVSGRNVATVRLINSNRDTVSSIGVVRGKRLLPGTTDGMQHVCFFRHALALDERRVKFLPEYAYGGGGPPLKVNPDDNNAAQDPVSAIPDRILMGSN